MKNVLAAWATATILAMAGGTASASFITITDFDDGVPVTVTDLAGAVVTGGFEEVTVSGDIVLPATGGAPVPVGTRAVILDEPGSDPFGPRVSDYLLVTVGPQVTGPNGSTQSVRIVFQSDGAANFDNNVAQLPTGTPILVETGAAQDVTTPLNSNASFVINLGSDLGTQEPGTPEPSSLALVSLGALGLIGFGRGLRRRRCG